ncbi:7-alpha-hydroxysteroid dehydrogenase [Limimaricola cinnabarinus]|uniref:7-alpha-hydroxysteroid dehydrogenase n=1 Tax=Limimaricola cinnabarinus TaxID=1125964 RepID=UPI00249211DD|nr:7-alpha-hydroxysteroid dehydrogenase [Limimaricola cinnabarinus]
MFDPKSFRLDGAVALITGGGAGIGRAIAETFAGAGAAVMVSDLDAEAARAVADDITEAGGQAASLGCDVTEEADLVRAVEQTVSRFGKLTILVGNAGGGGPKPFDMPMAEFRRAFDLNVFSLFRLAQLAAPEMEKAGGGAMLAITSMAAENRNRRMASYGASKAATSHLVRNIAFDLGPAGIRVNAIAPGATRTEALTSVLTDDIEKRMLAHTPINRLGEPADMANAALFMCSPAAGWISGQVLTVSGGGVQELD